MNIVIIYFSGTGNTELIARELGLRFQKSVNSVELVSLEDKARLEELDLKGKVLGFGFPVYKFSFPDIFLDHLQEINRKAQNNPYFLFSTYARFTADSFHEFTKRLNRKKFQFIAEESFKSPSCGISARKGETDFEYASVMFFEDHIDKKLDLFTKRVLETNKPIGKRGFHFRNPLGALRLKIVKDIERTKYPKLQIDPESCSVCGLCAKKCPESNLITREDHIEILDDKDCLHCLRCMNHCPTNSIHFGELSLGTNRYTLRKRDELFQKAISGYQEKYWQDFEKICSQWRSRTVKYWWQNRKKPKI